MQVKLPPSGNRIAFTVVTDAGTEAQKAYVRELPLGCALVWDLAEIEGISALEWLGEDAILFTVPDVSGRPHKVQNTAHQTDSACCLHFAKNNRRCGT